jgi:hypothetical protein
MFDDDPLGVMQVAYGDTMNLTADFCPEYKEKSITAVKIIETGMHHEPDAKPPMYKHYFIGKAA